MTAAAAPRRLPGAAAAAFAHVLVPLPGESLLGFVMRLDLANHLPIGTTAKAIGRHPTGWRALSPASWASGAVFDLVRLAQLSGNDLDAVRELTFVPELTRLFGRSDVPIDSLGRLGARMCIGCWAESRLIRRLFALDYVTACVWHGRGLVPFCPCRVGAPGPCHHGAPPAPLSPPELSRQRDVARIWTLLLELGTPEIVGAGYRVVARRRRSEARILHRLPKRLQYASRSIATLVRALHTLEIDPDLLRDLLVAEARPAGCPNQACPRYGPRADPDPVASRVERHCPTCGSRFVGRRILLTFDLHHGAPSPSPGAVRKAQRRLRRWNLDLHVVCAELVAEGREPEIVDAFRRAGIPMNANLRAARLGLTSIVRDAARRRRLMIAGENVPFAHIGMADYTELIRRARNRDWLGIAEWGVSHGVVPGCLDERPAWWTYPPDPQRGLLEPLFDRRWALAAGSHQVARIWQTATERDGRLLSVEWRARISARVSRCDDRASGSRGTRRPTSLN